MEPVATLIRYECLLGGLRGTGLGRFVGSEFAVYDACWWRDVAHGQVPEWYKACFLTKRGQKGGRNACFSTVRVYPAAGYDDGANDETGRDERD
jgi:hypothetical protein